MKRFSAQNRNDRTMKKKSLFSSTYQSGERPDCTGLTGLRQSPVRLVRSQSGGERTGKSLRRKVVTSLVRSLRRCASRVRTEGGALSHRRP
jgi:hypothetical protein